jgi:ATP-dependent DNA ligase
MRLLRTPEPFDHPEFVFEPKLDGFRALVHVTGHQCELVSRNGHQFKSWPQLGEEIAHAVKAYSAVLDGEICCLQSDGRPNFHSLMFRRVWPWFYAFDVLSVNGQDLRGLSRQVINLHLFERVTREHDGAVCDNRPRQFPRSFGFQRLAQHRCSIIKT